MFAHVAQMLTIRACLQLQHGSGHYQMDAMKAFLHSTLSKVVYMTSPSCNGARPWHVCCLRRALACPSYLVWVFLHKCVGSWLLVESSGSLIVCSVYMTWQAPFLCWWHDHHKLWCIWYSVHRASLTTTVSVEGFWSLMEFSWFRDCLGLLGCYCLPGRSKSLIYLIKPLVF